MNLLSLLLGWTLMLNSSFQDMPQVLEEDEIIWYIWLDTPAMVQGEQVRLIGNKPFRITCCVKSGKYNRLQKAAVKWVKENYDPGITGKSILKNIKDESLALKVIADAKSSDSDLKIIMVDYSDSCK